MIIGPMSKPPTILPPTILFVCLGNICRSPTAEAVFRQRTARSGLEVIIDSAGTGGWHAGERPDPRAIEHGALKGYDLTDQSARKVTRTDFSSFDFILAMDAQNLSHLRDMCPSGYSGHLSRFLDFAPNIADKNVPDPYYGGADGFNQVIALIEAASDGLIAHLSRDGATKTS